MARKTALNSALTTRITPRLLNRTERPLGSSLILALLVLIMIGPGVGDLQAQEISSEALEQINYLMEQKRNRSEIEKKIDSSLLLELESRRSGVFRERLPKLEVPRKADAQGLVLLDANAEVSAELLLEIERLGGTVHSAFERWGAVRLTLPIDRLEDLAGTVAVRTIRPADAFMTQMINTTEGDVAHAADDARATFGLDGTGVKVGAMSDSVDALATLQGSGDLPPGVTVIPGQSGNPGTSEGTALLEIVHDMAPGAELFFATGSGGQAQMAQNILDLEAEGCTVIVDDVLYFSELVFQDGIIAQAVNEVAAKGVAYFSSAGNSGNLAAGEAGVWEGDYLGTTLPAPLNGAAISAHDFGGGTNNNELTADTPFFITLQWSDPSLASDNDYDLFLLDAALANVIAASTNTQNGTQDPFEFIDSLAPDHMGHRVVVTKFGGLDRFIHVNTHRGRLGTGTDGQIFGHPAAEGAITVAAVNVATAGGGEFTGGAANPPEFFSSDGPRRIFFEADGSPVAGAFLSAGTQPNTVRQKPDITAADGVMTATPGFNPFFGTSASAPHGAGMAALIKEILSSLDADGMKSRLTRDALDIGAPGTDNVSGSGIPKADDAIEGKKGFQDDEFSVKTKLAANGKCSSPHNTTPGTDTATFDGQEDQIDAFDDGTQPTVSESESDPDNLTEGGGELGGESENTLETNINIEANGDLFPEGFEDPDTGTPLTDACIEIGIDDALEGDCPVNVQSAVVQPTIDSEPFGSPIDITDSFFGSPFDGRTTVLFPGLAGQGINGMVIKLQMQTPDPQAIFADGFESGDASSWTDQAP